MSQESFNVSGMANKFAMDKINVAFQSIQKLIDKYEPDETKQDYALFSFTGTLKIGDKIKVSIAPISHTSIFGLYGTTYVKVGDLTPSGIFTAIREGDFIIYQPYRRDKVKEEI